MTTDNESLASRFADQPLLAAATSRWRLATSEQNELPAVFDRLSRAFSSWPRSGEVQFRITRDDQESSWSLHCGPEGGHVWGVDQPVPDPDLEILVDEETWWQLVRGSISPLDAFGGGRMRVIGDLTLARHIVESLGEVKTTSRRPASDERS